MSKNFSREQLLLPSLSTDISINGTADFDEDLKQASPLSLSGIPLRSLKEEYALLNKITDTKKHKSLFIENNLIINSLNRYKKILPFKNSIVKLDDAPEISPSNYINANLILDIEPGEFPANFIATQGPLASTSSSFWRMVTKFDAPLIISIIEPKLIGERCHPYWPVSNNKKVITPRFKIKEADFYPSSFLDLKSLSVVNRENGLISTTTHVHIKDWRDGTSIEKSRYSDFIELLKMLHTYFQDFVGKPIIIHCSAGIGRTCTLIAAYYLYARWLKCIQQYEEFTFSVYQIVKYLRGFRWMAVHSFEQYVFLYEIVKCFRLDN